MAMALLFLRRLVDDGTEGGFNVNRSESVVRVRFVRRPKVVFVGADTADAEEGVFSPRRALRFRVEVDSGRGAVV